MSNNNRPVVYKEVDMHDILNDCENCRLGASITYTMADAIYDYLEEMASCSEDGKAEWSTDLLYDLSVTETSEIWKNMLDAGEIDPEDAKEMDADDIHQAVSDYLKKNTTVLCEDGGSWCYFSF